MDPDVVREILSSLWKIHILHHAGEHAVVGNWMLQELREHGYDVSPGTLYPLLHRMEERGWLASEKRGEGTRAPRAYSLTPKGEQVLDTVRAALRELVREVDAHPREEHEG